MQGRHCELCHLPAGHFRAALLVCLSFSYLAGGQRRGHTYLTGAILPHAHAGSERVSKRDVWDSCEEFFKKYGYDVKYLKKCGIEMREGKQPKELKPKKDSDRRLLAAAS